MRDRPAEPRPAEPSRDSRPCLGLIVLQVDETIEDDARRLFAPADARLHVTRVPSGAELTPDTILRMEADLPAAAALLPQAAEFDTVAYGCTSGTAAIGAERVRALIHSAVRTRTVTDPLSAALAALAALGLSRIGIVSPYIDGVAAPIRTAFEQAGVAVGETRSFGEEVEARVARIPPAEIRAAALDLAARGGIDGLFLSCTNLRTLDIIADLEATLDMPVLSSTQALAWHMARLAGARPSAEAPGRLMRLATR